MPRNLGLTAEEPPEGGQEFTMRPGFPAIKTRRETWVVKADDIDQDEDVILDTTGIPHEGDTRGIMGCRRVVARNVEPHALLWHVDVDWDSRVEGTVQNPDPTLLPVDLNWSSDSMELPALFPPSRHRRLRSS